MGLIRKELEGAPDISEDALVRSGWFYKYRQVVTHNRGPQALLNIIEASQVFREWWA